LEEDYTVICFVSGRLVISRVERLSNRNMACLVKGESEEVRN